MNRVLAYLPIFALVMGMLSLVWSIYSDFDAARHDAIFCTHEGDPSC
jgi:hypothetical protein